jgi:Cu/Ag efflux protein CusF
VTYLFRQVPSVALALIIAASTGAVAHIHGKIVAIDSARHTFQIHHDPFAAMPMAMTMEVAPKRPGDLAKLHVGETVDLTVDTSAVPWSATDIRPARAGAASAARRPR